MKDREKTEPMQAANELGELRQRVAELEALEVEHKRTREALQESEEKYRALTENAPNGIFISDIAQFVYVNRRMCEITGFSRDELLNMPDPVGSLFASEERERILAYARSRLGGGPAPPSYEARGVRKDGETAWFKFTVSSILLSGNRMLQGTVEDITDRKWAEEALRRRAEELAALQQTVLGITAPHDLPTLLQTIVERAALLLGAPSGGMYLCEPDQEQVRCVVSYRTPQDHTGTVLKYGEGAAGTVAQTKEPLLIADYRVWNGRADVFEDEQPFITILSAPMIWQGQVTGVIHVLDGAERRFTQADLELLILFANHAAIAVENARLYEEAQKEITERKQAEEERERLLAQIQEQAQRVQQIVDTVPEGVLLLRTDQHADEQTDWRVVLVNPVAEKYLAVLADAKVGNSLTHLGDRPLAELLSSPPEGLWHEVAADGWDFQVIARPFEVGFTSSGARTEPAEGWVVVVRDVTQQREIERRVQQQERLAVVGQLAAGIAHDFNNIMASIVLYAQMTAQMEGLPAAVQGRMETINQQAGHATNLIQQILDFSRQAMLERRPLDLVLLLEEHVKLLERTLPESIRVRLNYEPGERAAPLMVNADPTRMQQMVTNLALNARDAMVEGGDLCIGLERIEIKPGESPLVPEMAAGEWIRVTVSDTGGGIPPDALPHIFEPFFTTKAPLGSGLGLSQVYGIVGQHGGRVDVETRPGEGTTFTIYLPAVPMERPDTSDSLPQLPSLIRGQGQTILVVEDNNVVRKVLVESLKLLNYQVLQATNGQEALAMLEQYRDEIDLLLSDVVMPEMGGVALLHALKEKGLAVRVVMLTGHPVRKQMEELRAQGMIDWLPKPPRLEQLAEVIARALGAGGTVGD
jgi:PAS domain S-box-containing protein